METRIKQANFLETLKWIQGIVEKRSTMPVLSNILLETDNQKIQISATDLEVSLQLSCPAQVIVEGKVLINAKGLHNIVREAPKEEICILEEKDHGVSISSGRSQFRVLGMPISEFPTLPATEERELFEISTSGLLEMIDNTSYAISNDESRYTLNGVYLEKRKAAMRMVATDGHRLSYLDREVGKDIPLSEGVIIPRKGLLVLRKLIEDSGVGVRLGFGVKELLVVGQSPEGDEERINLFIRLIEGKFPEYSQVIPKKSDRIISLNREAFTGALRRAAIIAEDQSRAVQFSVSPGHLEVSSSNPELGEVKEDIDVEYKGKSFQVGFNARYFLDILNVLKDEKVVLELGDELSPCVIRSEFDRGFLSLVMPMRL